MHTGCHHRDIIHLSELSRITQESYKLISSLVLVVVW